VLDEGCWVAMESVEVVVVVAAGGGWECELQELTATAG
jgi:hypothetical protein